MHCPSPRGASIRCALLSAIAAFLPITSVAAETPSQDGFDISGSFRVRGDAVDGQFRPGKAEDDAILMLRTTLLASYTANPVTLVAELFDARVYGQDPTTPIGTGEVNALEPLQAYVGLDLGSIIGSGFGGDLKAGRLTMDIGSSRLIGRSGDSNFPTAYTGTMVDLTAPGENRFQIFWTMPNVRLPKDNASLQDNEVEFDRSTGDVQFYGAHYSRPLLAGVEGEVFAYQLEEKDAPGYATNDRNLFTYGARVSRAPSVGAVDFDVEYAHQQGEVRASSAATDTTDLEVDAYMLHAEIGRKLVGDWSPRVSAHFDVASGDGSDADYGRFDPLFGIRRGEFGPTSIYGPVKRSNVVSGGVQLEAKPSERFKFSAMYRALWLEDAADSFAATGVRDPLGASGKWAGNQLELRLRYWLIPGQVELEGGAAYLDKGRFLREAPNAPSTGDTRYAYLSLLTAF
jgi:hypothetical protein